MSDDDSRMRLTPVQICIIQRVLPEFSSTNKIDRVKIWKKLAAELKATDPMANQRELQKAARDWLYNRSDKHDKAAKTLHSRQWSTTQVFVELHGNRLAREVREKTGVPNGAIFLATYATHVKDSWLDVPEEEKESFQEMATEWKDQAPPLNMQQKNAGRQMGGWIQKFAKDIFLQCGVRIFVLSANTGGNGDVNIMSHCYNEDLGMGQSFKKSQPKWRNGSIMEEWGTYASRMFPDASRDPSDAEESAGKRKLVADMATDEEGLLLLPNLGDVTNGEMPAGMMEAIIRHYITSHYLLVNGKMGKSTPWGKILGNQDGFILAKYLPPAFELANKVFCFHAYWTTKNGGTMIPTTQPLRKRQHKTQGTGKSRKRQHRRKGVDAVEAQDQSSDDEEEEQAIYLEPSSPAALEKPRRIKARLKGQMSKANTSRPTKSSKWRRVPDSDPGTDEGEDGVENSSGGECECGAAVCPVKKGAQASAVKAAESEVVVNDGLPIWTRFDGTRTPAHDLIDHEGIKFKSRQRAARDDDALPMVMEVGGQESILQDARMAKKGLVPEVSGGLNGNGATMRAMKAVRQSGGPSEGMSTASPRKLNRQGKTDAAVGMGGHPSAKFGPPIGIKSTQGKKPTKNVTLADNGLPAGGGSMKRLRQAEAGVCKPNKKAKGNGTKVVKSWD